MLWAALLHDLKKRSAPIIEGKDHIHGFTSAGLALEIFLKKGYINAPANSENRQLIEKTIQLINESNQPLP